MNRAVDALSRALQCISVPQHIGMLVPWANTIVETELPRLTGPDIVWHYARLVPSSRTTTLGGPFFEGILAAIPGALDQLSRIDLDLACFACTSASMGDQPLPQTKTGGPRLLGAFDAIVAALAHLGARAVALVTPYQDEVTADEQRALTRAGFDVVATRSLGLTEDLDMIPNEVLATEIRCLMNSLSSRNCDAIVASCTNMPTLTLYAGIEDEYGLPFISSNMALALAASRNGV